MNGRVVLNLPFRPRSYDEPSVETINKWVNFFIENNLRVIAAPPMERIDVKAQIQAADHENFTFNPVMSFDTCDRWRSGLALAVDHEKDECPFFLWSADFKYNNKSVTAASDLLKYSGNADLVVGTIQAEGTKEAIDECATKPLIKMWFPEYWQYFQNGGFAKPRSELLRFTLPFLKSALSRRWYPTEQTINLLLQCFESNYTAYALPFKKLSDAPEARDNPNVVEQVERMELWLKYMWRERFKDRIVDEYVLMSKKSALVLERAYHSLLALMGGNA